MLDALDGKLQWAHGDAIRHQLGRGRRLPQPAGLGRLIPCPGPPPAAAGPACFHAKGTVLKTTPDSVSDGLVVVVACSAAKLATTVPVPAADLYVGPFHQMCRRAAHALAGNAGTVLVLSAAHGVVTLDEPLAPYELRMGESGSVRPDQLRAQARRLGLHRVAQLVALGGRAYVDAVAGVRPDVLRPLDGCRGIGQQRARLSLIASCRRLLRGGVQRLDCVQQVLGALHERVPAQPEVELGCLYVARHPLVDVDIDDAALRERGQAGRSLSYGARQPVRDHCQQPCELGDLGEVVEVARVIGGGVQCAELLDDDGRYLDACTCGPHGGGAWQPSLTRCDDNSDRPLGSDRTSLAANSPRAVCADP
ncbi:DUF6884 domain-containing protein [Streptomyces sp. NBC_01361]|uniref:DUF6884 domain-containing protein n=1 Tax=Streptomyces sp. NBC_01361 TaxID=2903838 RepID=UPI003FCD92EF